MIQYFLDLPLTVQVCAGVLLTFLLGFLFSFLLPGLFFLIRIGRLLRGLRRMKEEDGGDPTSLFERDRTLSHLWQEFKDTLHEQKEVNARTGVYEIVAVRSTVPAEAFFSTQALVDSRLSTEFFRHLPGIFTGIGIIGTFYGLLQGLNAFRVSENPQIARESLESLLHGVSHAFIVSAIAITFAMVVTLVEKLLVAGLYRKVEELAYLLDSMFEAGAGEEYLARLVKASEDSASQTKILKDALVADLKQVLFELTQQQIQAQVAGNQQLGQQIVEGLQAGLRDPLDRIATAVQQVGQDQGSAVNKLLTDVLSAFSQRLQELFGGQIAGINQLQQQTIQALQAAVVKLEQMASTVETAGQRSSDAMAAKLTEALGAMEGRQQLMNERMTEFVEQIRGLVRDSQSETNQKLQAILSDLGEKTAAMVGALKDQAEQATAAHLNREQRAAQHTEETVTRLSGQVDTVVAEVAKASADMRASVEAMRAVTSEAVSKMNGGADTLYIAASEFAKAGLELTRFRGHLILSTRRCPQCRNQDPHIRRSIGARSSPWFVLGVTPMSSPPSSSARHRPSATGWPRPKPTRASATMCSPAPSARSCASCAGRTSSSSSSARSWQKPRPGSHGRPIRSPTRIRIREGESGRLEGGHHVSSPGGLRQRLLHMARACALGTGAV